MAEPLKNSFGAEVAEYLADLIGAVVPRFPGKKFIAASVDGLDELELMQRSRHVAEVLGATLPADRAEALQVVIDALGREGPAPELHGMEGFRYMPLVDFVAVYGLDHFELAMTLQHELTQRFTAEFSIRPYLVVHRDATLDRLRQWTADPSEHVRRLVSEGTRPRLPWAPRLRDFMADPAPVVELLELLKDDSSEYVRRSVANNVNDIAKDHPDVAVAIAQRWWRGASPDRQRLVKHGLRTLIKQGDPGALAVIGFGADTPLRLTRTDCVPAVVAIGETTRIEIDLHNPTDDVHGALVDIVVHFVKANGSTSPKVFKGAEVDVAPGATSTVRKTVSLKVHSTRTPYAGEHRVEALVNGATYPVGSFAVSE